MALEIFLKLDGIEGDSGDHEYPFTIDILSFSWGVHATDGASGASKLVVHDVSITKFTDRSSTPLMLRKTNGKHIPNGTIIVRKASDRRVDMRIQLIDIWVDDVKFDGYDKGRRREELSLRFADSRIEL